MLAMAIFILCVCGPRKEREEVGELVGKGWVGGWVGGSYRSACRYFCRRASVITPPPPPPPSVAPPAVPPPLVALWAGECPPPLPAWLWLRLLVSLKRSMEPDRPRFIAFVGRKEDGAGAGGCVG